MDALFAVEITNELTGEESVIFTRSASALDAPAAALHTAFALWRWRKASTSIDRVVPVTEATE